MVVEREHDRSLEMEPQPVSQFESNLVGSWANQQDDEEHSPGQVEAATQLETSSIGRF